MSHVLWTFTEAVSEPRRESLLSVSGFDEIVSSVCARSAVVDRAVVPAHDAYLKGCSRVEFRLRVPPEVLDKFFNSPAGYRGQYVIAPDHGVMKNQFLIAKLLPKLIKDLVEQSFDENSIELSIRSLNGTDAKIWVEDSAGEELLDSARLVIHIDNPLWVAHAQAAYAGTGDVSTDADLTKALRGVIAPEGEFLEVKGGWIENASGTERRNPRKAGRAVEIQQYGWA